MDVKADAEVEKIFNAYKDAMSRLSKAYPKTIIIHSTIPLTTLQTGIKATIKKIIGRSPYGVDENIKRFEFNELLKKEFNKTYIFDIAGVESTRPDGSKETFSKDNNTYPSLVPEYTADSGHLNKTGRGKAAEQLLLLLVNLD